MDTQPGSIFKVRKDSIGLFVNVHGCIYRPYAGTSEASEGDCVEFLGYTADEVYFTRAGWGFT